MMMGPMTFGKIWRNKIRARLRPSETAASTNSCFFTAMTWALTMRAMVNQPMAPMAMNKGMSVVIGATRSRAKPVVRMIHSVNSEAGLSTTSANK